MTARRKVFMGKDCILHVRASNFFGGPERQILGHALAEKGFRHHVATFAEAGGRNELAAECEKAGVPVTVIPAEHPFSPGPVLALRALVRGQGVRVVCTHGYKPAVLCALAVQGTGARLLPFARGHTRENAKVALFERLELLVMAYARTVVSVSEGYAEYLAGRGISREKVRVVVNAIDTEAYTAGAPPRNEARKRLCVGEDEPLIVSAGRLSPEKGHADVLDAFALVARRVPRARLFLLGDGPERERLSARARDRGLSNVAFLGFRKDAPLFYSAMDLFVLPSLTEGLPNVVLEAFAFGKPVAATRVGGVPEVVEHGKSGLIVPAGAHGPLAEAMERILLSPDRGAAMGEQGRARVVMRFGFEAQARALAAVYAGLLAR